MVKEEEDELEQGEENENLSLDWGAQRSIRYGFREQNLRYLH